MSVRFDLTTFGELMLRLSVPLGERLEATNQLDLYPGGAEANVAAALARLGRQTAWFSSLPVNPLGRLAASHLRAAGVDLSGVIWQGAGRIGTYYVEFAAPPRPTQVIYDRADSCITQMDASQVDWDLLLDTRIIHLTGITPALSPGCRTLIPTIIARARAAGIPISFDINYRAKLWAPAAAQAALTPLIQGVEVLFCSQEDAARVFGINGEPETVLRQLADSSAANKVVMSIGDQGVLAWDGTTILQQAAVPAQIVDRIGAGDALAAGVLHGWCEGDLPLGLRCGVTLAALALSQYGDFVITSPEEVAALLAAAHGTSRVSR
ncbi:MAG: sugar kinase [Chloroflexi bacterium]|nr:sugar kinase [Chloroflexota bacterium]